MKTTLDLPDDLIKEVKLCAVHEGKKLEAAVEELLRRGLAAETDGPATAINADKATLRRREELTRKFVSGEWGVELAGYESSKRADRRSESRRAKPRRK